MKKKQRGKDFITRDHETTSIKQRMHYINKDCNINTGK